MKPFLKSLAEQYASRYTDLSQFCFVFPGKRSGKFFLTYLADSIGNRTMIAPEVTTISDLIDKESGLIADNRIDLLFLLYNCYCDVLRENFGEDADMPDFNSFWSWGDMVLSDFNDIDTHLADPDSLFKNLSDLNEIATDFLTDEQRDVMEKYFGMKPPHRDVERFWRNFNYNRDHRKGDHGAIKSKFLYLWQAMAPLYHRFNKALVADGLSYSGMAARLALQSLKQRGEDSQRAYKKLVFVGFNVLTAVEWKIFQLLSGLRTTLQHGEEPYADFVWDLPGGPMEDKHNLASRYVKRGIEHFPKPEWLSLHDSDTAGIPEKIYVISSPSNAEQTKLTGIRVKHLHAKVTQQDFDDAKVAVILPDEELLVPMIHSVPEEIGDVNLTMGMSLRHTPVATLVTLLRRLQTRARVDAHGVYFYHEDIEGVLAHPLAITLLGPDEVMKIKGRLFQGRRKFVKAQTITQVCEESGMIFQVADRGEDVRKSVSYIDRILARLEEKFCIHTESKESGEGGDEKDEAAKTADRSLSFHSLTRTHIAAYRRALSRLVNACELREIHIDFKTAYHLVDRLIGGEKVQFEGEPMKGLQIMGLLETRSLDFDHIVIPSMNERIFPRKLRTRSFIPNSLRVAFGLPTSRSQESIFAYYFYRLISRARTLTLIYDARTGGTRSGDPSRYILQLERLYAPGKIKKCAAHFTLALSDVPSIRIERSKKIQALLADYLDNGKRALSASSMMKFMNCPLDFYYRYLLHIKVKEAPSEFMSAIDLGNVIHRVMMWLYMDPIDYNQVSYQPVTPRPLTPAFFGKLLSDTDKTIEKTVHYAINREYLHRPLQESLKGEAFIQAKVIADVVRDVVAIDSRLSGLEIIGCEVPLDAKRRLDDGREVKFKLIIDRIDKIIGDNGETHYRIVDYKSGSAGVTCRGPESIFSGEHDTKYVFQLLFYSELARMLPALSGVSELTPVIYDIPNLKPVSPRIQNPNNTKDVITVSSDRMTATFKDGTLLDIHQSFQQGLDALLETIFSATEPICQREDPSGCSYCDFKEICRR